MRTRTSCPQGMPRRTADSSRRTCLWTLALRARTREALPSMLAATRGRATQGAATAACQTLGRARALGSPCSESAGTWPETTLRAPTNVPRTAERTRARWSTSGLKLRVGVWSLVLRFLLLLGDLGRLELGCALIALGSGVTSGLMAPVGGSSLGRGSTSLLTVVASVSPAGVAVSSWALDSGSDADVHWSVWLDPERVAAIGLRRADV